MAHSEPGWGRLVTAVLQVVRLLRCVVYIRVHETISDYMQVHALEMRDTLLYESQYCSEVKPYSRLQRFVPNFSNFQIRLLTEMFLINQNPQETSLLHFIVLLF